MSKTTNPLHGRSSRRRFVLGASAASLLAACGSSSSGNHPTSGGGSNNAGGTTNAGGTNHSGRAGASAAHAGGAGGVNAGGAGGGAGGAGANVCTVYPAQTAGPFYIDEDLLRQDITEGKEGALLVLTIQVVRAHDCSPLAGAAVDIWHCDAEGVYSAFPGQLGGLDTSAERFLRGTQITNQEGEVTFRTIYPGWYPGRTTHIHFKVRPTATTEATSQLYFPEDVTEQIYSLEPYAARGPKDTSNTHDQVNRGSVPPLASTTSAEDGWQARLTVNVAG